MIRLFKGLASFFVGLFAVILTITIGISVFNLTPYLNDYFSTRSTDIVAVDEDEEEDTEFYKSAYDSVDDMIDAKIANIKKT